MSNTNHFDIAVIGAGLIGSAAARHLSQAGQSTLILGPSEPEKLETHQGVFASHYDQGRLTRLIGRDLIWAQLAKQAIANYRSIEAHSGISFYNPVGLVVVSKPDDTNNYLRAPLDTAEAIGAHYDFYEATDKSWKTVLPYLSFPDEFPLLHEHAPAGYINPRALVKAQLACAEQNGATLVRDTAIGIQKTEGLAQIATATGQTYTAKKVIIACGAFTNFNNLLATPIPLTLKTETIILGEVSEETAVSLKEMPTVIYQIEDPNIDDIYMAPPILYPDGRYYIKMGCNTRTDQKPSTLEEVQRWFHSGDSETCRPAMAQALQAQLPSIEFKTITSHRCIVCYTPSGYPTVDQIDENLFVATGGNGSGAKGSDTIGRLAADLVLGKEWPSEIERRPFMLSQQPA